MGWLVVFGHGLVDGVTCSLWLLFLTFFIFFGATLLEAKVSVSVKDLKVSFSQSDIKHSINDGVCLV